MKVEKQNPGLIKVQLLQILLIVGPENSCLSRLTITSATSLKVAMGANLIVPAVISLLITSRDTNHKERGGGGGGDNCEKEGASTAILFFCYCQQFF